MKGSTYLIGNQSNNDDYDWDKVSEKSEEEFYGDCDHRPGVTFDNGAEYTG